MAGPAGSGASASVLHFYESRFRTDKPVSVIPHGNGIYTDAPFPFTMQ